MKPEAKAENQGQDIKENNIEKLSSQAPTKPDTTAESQTRQGEDVNGGKHSPQTQIKPDANLENKKQEKPEVNATKQSPKAEPQTENHSQGQNDGKKAEGHTIANCSPEIHTGEQNESDKKEGQTEMAPKTTQLINPVKDVFAQFEISTAANNLERIMGWTNEISQNGKNYSQNNTAYYYRNY